MHVISVRWIQFELYVVWTDFNMRYGFYTSQFFCCSEFKTWTDANHFGFGFYSFESESIRFISRVTSKQFRSCFRSSFSADCALLQTPAILLDKCEEIWLHYKRNVVLFISIYSIRVNQCWKTLKWCNSTHRDGHLEALRISFRNCDFNTLKIVASSNYKSLMTEDYAHTHTTYSTALICLSLDKNQNWVRKRNDDNIWQINNWWSFALKCTALRNT